jgi:hypothetical protein
MAISNWAGAPVGIDDGVALSDGEGDGDGDGDAEFVDPGVNVAPPVDVGVATDVPHALATMAVARIAAIARALWSFALPYRVGADTRSLCRSPLANMPLPPVW